jgi:hypothetical protein
MVLINKSIFSGHPIIVRRVTFQGCVRVFDGGVTETGLRECDGVTLCLLSCRLQLPSVSSCRLPPAPCKGGVWRAGSRVKLWQPGRIVQ